MEKSEKQQKAPCTATTAPLTKGNFKNKAKKKEEEEKKKNKNLRVQVTEAACRITAGRQTRFETEQP
jgi:hypothetical protein